MADNLVGDACRFFDHLADLVDPKYYYDDQREPVNMRFMKKTARSAAKAALKEHYKQNKRAKLDPDAAVTTVELQRSKQEAKQRGAASEAGQSSQRQQQQDQGQEAAGLQLKIASGSLAVTVTLLRTPLSPSPFVPLKRRTPLQPSCASTYPHQHCKTPPSPSSPFNLSSPNRHLRSPPQPLPNTHTRPPRPGPLS